MKELFSLLLICGLFVACRTTQKVKHEQTIDVYRASAPMFTLLIYKPVADQHSVKQGQVVSDSLYMLLIHDNAVYGIKKAQKAILEEKRH